MSRRREGRTPERKGEVGGYQVIARDFAAVCLERFLKPRHSLLRIRRSPVAFLIAHCLIASDRFVSASIAIKTGAWQTDQVALGCAVSVLSCFSVHLDGPLRVSLRSTTFGIAHGQVVLRFREEHLACSHEQLQGRFFIFCNPVSLCVAVSKCTDRLRVCLSRRCLIPLHCCIHVPVHPLALVVAATQCVLRFSIALLCGAAEPVCGLLFVKR